MTRTFPETGDPEFVAAELRRAVTVTRPPGGIKAAVILDELNLHAEKVDQTHIQPLLTALFEVADEINVEEDRGGGFSMASNDLCLHWLLRSLTRNRLSLNERSAVYVAACQSASLGWLANTPDEIRDSTPHSRWPDDGYGSIRLRNIHAFFSCTWRRWVRTSQAGWSMPMSMVGLRCMIFSCLAARGRPSGRGYIYPL